MMQTARDLSQRFADALTSIRQVPALGKTVDALSGVAVRAALIGGSLASGQLFWVRASLGENQLRMHRCTPEGEISIGGVSEQLYGEGFLGAWHEVLGRELGEALPSVLYEVGLRGARWEAARAVELGVWVPKALRSFVGHPALLEKVRSSALYHALAKETFRIVMRMIMTEGGWGRVDEVDLRGTPMRAVVSNAPEPRRLGYTGACSCHLTTGAFAGYAEVIFGMPMTARETTCRSRGDVSCTFEIEPQAEAAARAA
jgi:predicted hydrocarbon binding protein